MFKLDTEADVQLAFRPKDQKLVELGSDLKLPLIIRDYVAWAHPAGGRMYLVFAPPAGGAPTGIVFETNGTGTSVSQMCDWCHCGGTGTEIGLLTARLNAKKTVGVNLCSDLSCKEKLEKEADRTNANLEALLAKVIERMSRFAAEALEIDLQRR